ncbi:ABC transporter ATP-binding protein [Desulfobacca acetoxidans]|uniref:Iron-chelate-transporting ATPase n=1 Tax=Desulfobacca acetoxidans (strain ATCC 700848 / DSM 11109 / ASRB2) TaxID=880072 RepID=F2NG57_DESAR|nr:ABC transporter ATP-binding protein [Desulfobacca acetoxidans]AEB08470.1 Iron-chelate-transporting ATPase [Desulfobacca acetoxidans DSM 11109]
MNPAVCLEQVFVGYGDRPILHDLSFEVATGSFFIVIGPNSSGKTTLAKTLAGIIRPLGGKVEILGRPLASYSRKSLARQVAVVPQYSPIEAPFSVTEVVLMGRSPHLSLAGLETNRDLRIAAEAMEATNVTHLAKRRLNQLSGGELQRVVIARAICQQPQIIILDEPTASLDLAHQVHIMDLMEKLKKERGFTIIMISHDLNLAAMYGDTLLLLHKGRVASQGCPSTVLTYEQLEQIYGCILLVGENPLMHRPQVTLVPGRFIQENLQGVSQIKSRNASPFPQKIENQ